MDIVDKHDIEFLEKGKSKHGCTPDMFLENFYTRAREEIDHRAFNAALRSAALATRSAVPTDDGKADAQCRRGGKPSSQPLFSGRRLARRDPPVLVRLLEQIREANRQWRQRQRQ